MIESSASNKFDGLIRPFVGGLLSAFIAGVFFYGVHFFFSNENALATSIIELGIGFAFPAIVIKSSSFVILLLITTGFWFLVGATIAYFARKNIVAISLWLVLYLIPFCFFGFMMAASAH